jgi:hypothetical protein
LRSLFTPFLFCLFLNLFPHSYAADTTALKPVFNAGLDVYSNFQTDLLQRQKAGGLVENDFYLLDINLAWLSVSWQQDWIRLKATPAMGYFMQKNYGQEPFGLRNLLEGYGGFRLSASRNIWLDAGVLPSPVAFENGFSHLQIIYTRGLAAEFSPYYFTGLRLSVPLSSKTMLRLYGLNGWQVIQETNEGKAGLLNVEWNTGTNSSLNLNMYAGNEGNSSSPKFRYFTEVYYQFVYNKWKAALGTYAGWNKSNQTRNANYYQWFQANVALEYAFNPQHSLSWRGEFFHDPDQQMLGNGFEDFIAGTSLCYNFRITPQAMFRLEARSYLYDGLWNVAGPEPVGGNAAALISGFSWNF